MKTQIASLLLGVICFGGYAAMVSDVTARQRWPWNGMVDIDYTITGEDTENTSIAVSVRDTDTGRVYTPTNFLEVPPTVAGRHRITWSTEADKLNLIATNAVVTVSLLKYDATAVTNNLYYVIDLSGGPDAEKWPVTCLSAVPKGEWTDEYKTKKLVLRRIEPGTISGLNPTGRGEFFGAEFDEITIDKPYYIGVFEVTSAQLLLMTGNNSSWKQDDARPPMWWVTYDQIRGAKIGSLYPESTSVDPSSIIGILREKTGLVTIDIPTERQWEYACRAGTTSDYNNGGSEESDLKVLGRYYGNYTDGRGGFPVNEPAFFATSVGAYQPNQWGLYDMHGNVSEWCIDLIYDSGKGGSKSRAVRGGSFEAGLGDDASNHITYIGACRSGKRTLSSANSGSSWLGFRLCCSAEL